MSKRGKGFTIKYPKANMQAISRTQMADIPTGKALECVIRARRFGLHQGYCTDWREVSEQAEKDMDGGR